MKEGQTLEAESPVAAAVHRRSISPPATVTLRLGDVASQIPEAARLPAFDGQLRLDLPCADVFAGPVPKLPLSRLAAIAAEHVCLAGVPDCLIVLPAAQLALAYHFVTQPEVSKTADDDSDPRPAQDFAPRAKTSGPSESFAFAKESCGPEASEALPAEGVGLVSPASGEASDDVTPRTSSQTGLADPPATGVSMGDASTPPDPASDASRPVAAEADGETDGRPAVTVVREAILEHMPKAGLAEIPDQDGLQAIFMTEESLSVNRVVELCGGLPGIRSCVLAHGAAVVASYNVPESIDLVALSAHALEMLAAMRQSAAHMGIGAVPAVTIHSEKGPITFFQQSDLCLLVLHKDRGFVPGVREKLQQVVVQLSRANLALPVNASRPTLAPREAAF